MAAPIQSPAEWHVRSSYDFSTQEVIFQRKSTSVVQSGPRVQRFPLVSSPKETSRWEKFDDDDDEVQEVVMTWFKGQAADFYDSGIQRLVPRLNKYLDSAGDYVEK